MFLSAEMNMKTEKLFALYHISLFGINKAVTYSTYVLKLQSVKKIDSFVNLKLHKFPSFSCVSKCCLDIGMFNYRSAVRKRSIVKSTYIMHQYFLFS